MAFEKTIGVISRGFTVIFGKFNPAKYSINRYSYMCIIDNNELVNEKKCMSSNHMAIHLHDKEHSKS